MGLPEALRIVPDSELVSTPLCPICGADRAQAVRQLPLQDSPVVEMMRCPNCKASSASAMPSAAHLDKVYDPAHYSATLSNDAQITQALADNIVAEYRRSFALPNTKLKVLDYGGGNGKLAIAIRDKLRAAYPSGPEISATVVDIKKLTEDPSVDFLFVDEFLETDEHYDIIVASAVLEHIPDLQAILKRLLRSGEVDTLVYARCPFEVPLASLAGYRIRWPVHVHDIGPDFWRWVESDSDGRVSLLASRTSLTETSFRSAALRTTLAHLFKFPSHVEKRLLQPLFGYQREVWRLVGGWEAFLRVKASCAEASAAA